MKKQNSLDHTKFTSEVYDENFLYLIQKKNYYCNFNVPNAKFNTHARYPR